MKADIAKAISILEQEDVVAIPTETVYGLAGNALSEKAVSKIFEIKNRPSFDPLIVHVANKQAIEKWVTNIPNDAHRLMEKCMPGALTLLLPKKKIISDLVTSGLPRVGIRCPNHPVTHALLQALSFPLAAPSANPFGYISPTTSQHVRDQLGSTIPFILEGGNCDVGIESTIVGFEEDELVLYRPGGISQEELEKIVGKKIRVHAKPNILAPGQTLSHYAPRKKLVVGTIATLLAQYKNQSVGVITFSQAVTSSLPHRILSPTGDLREAARNLFSFLRQLDNENIEVILAEPAPHVGLGIAINDRLRRAAYRFLSTEPTPHE